MLRLTALVVIPFLLFGCGDDASGPTQDPSSSNDGKGGTGGGGGGPSENAGAWTGRWVGTVSCQGVYQDGNGSEPYSGTTGIEINFDANGHLLYPAGDKFVAQTHQGQVDQWVPNGGGVAKRLLAKYQDNGNQRFYRFEESVEQTDPDGTFTQSSVEEYDLRIDGNKMVGRYAGEIFSRTIFSSSAGSGIAESLDQANCEGELTKQ